MSPGGRSDTPRAARVAKAELGEGEAPGPALPRRWSPRRNRGRQRDRRRGCRPRSSWCRRSSTGRRPRWRAALGRVRRWRGQHAGRARSPAEPASRRQSVRDDRDRSAAVELGVGSEGNGVRNTGPVEAAESATGFAKVSVQKASVRKHRSAGDLETGSGVALDRTDLALQWAIGAGGAGPLAEPRVASARPDDCQARCIVEASPRGQMQLRLRVQGVSSSATAVPPLPGPLLRQVVLSGVRVVPPVVVPPPVVPTTPPSPSSTVVHPKAIAGSKRSSALRIQQSNTEPRKSEAEDRFTKRARVAASGDGLTVSAASWSNDPTRPLSQGCQMLSCFIPLSAALVHLAVGSVPSRCPARRTPGPPGRRASRRQPGRAFGRCWPGSRTRARLTTTAG